MQAREPMQFYFYDPISTEYLPITEETTIYVVKHEMVDANSAIVISFSLHGCQTEDLTQLGQDPFTGQTTYWVLPNPTHFSRLFEGSEEDNKFTLRSSPLSADEFSEILQITAEQLQAQFSPETAQSFSDAARRENFRRGADHLAATAVGARTDGPRVPIVPMDAAALLAAPRAALPENQEYLEGYIENYDLLMDLRESLDHLRYIAPALHTPEQAQDFMRYQAIQLDLVLLGTAIRNIMARQAEEAAHAPRMGMR